MIFDLNASYDNGYFDKDEQGWCARRVEVRREGDRVLVRTSGDDNGARAYDDTVIYNLGEYLPELGVVRLLNEQGRVASYFDLNLRGLRSVVEQEVERFAPPAGYISQAAREALGEALAPVARAFGLAVGEGPEMPLGELLPSATAEGALEARGEAREEAAVWRWMHRLYPDGGQERVGPHQVAVEIEGTGLVRTVVSVFVQAPEYANFVMQGSIEALPRALPLRAQAIAEWVAMPDRKISR